NLEGSPANDPLPARIPLTTHFRLRHHRRIKSESMATPILTGGRPQLGAVFQQMVEVVSREIDHESRCASRSTRIGARRPLAFALYFSRAAGGRDGLERHRSNRLAHGRRRPAARRVDRNLRTRFVGTHEPAAFVAGANDGPRGSVRARGLDGRLRSPVGRGGRRGPAAVALGALRRKSRDSGLGTRDSWDGRLSIDRRLEIVRRKEIANRQSAVCTGKSRTPDPESRIPVLGGAQRGAVAPGDRAAVTGRRLRAGGG